MIILKDPSKNYELKGTALVNYTNLKAAENAVNEMNGKKICEKEIRVCFKKSKEELNPEANLFIKNISSNYQSEFEKEMEKYGTVLSCKVRENGLGYV